MEQIWFRYRHDGSNYFGSFARGAEDTPYRNLDNVPWSELLRVLAEEIRDTGPKTELYAHRVDNPTLPPSRIDEETVALFYHDPVSAIRSWTIQVKEAVAKRSLKPIPAGHSVLARMFGSHVYLSMNPRNGQVESPITGEMVSAVKLGGGKCLPIEKAGKRWARVSIRRLLDESDAERFYFPRPWSNPDSWITRQELEQKLEKYLLEKAKAELK